MKFFLEIVSYRVTFYNNPTAWIYWNNVSGKINQNWILSIFHLTWFITVLDTAIIEP